MKTLGKLSYSHHRGMREFVIGNDDVLSHIAVVPYYHDRDNVAEFEAKAKAIVAACNVHDELMAALRECHDYLNEWCAGTNTPEGRKAVIAMNHARAALACHSLGM